MGNPTPCPLCGLIGSHVHQPHCFEIKGKIDGVREVATLRLAGCLACAQPVDAVINATDPCPAFILPVGLDRATTPAGQE